MKKLAGRHQRGITIVEVLITTTIVVFIITAIFGLFKEGLLHFDRTVNEAEIQLDLRLQLEKITKDIRESKVGTVAGQSYPYVDDNQLFLLKGTKENLETITYLLEEDQLIRKKIVGGIESEEILLEQIVEFTVNYEDELVKMKLKKENTTPYSNQSIVKVQNIEVKPRKVIFNE